MQASATQLTPIRFRVTPRMIAEFARLTGDHSSLHTDAAFARQSLYRECVAHGLLPVMFLAALPIPEPKAWRLESINGTFAKPVYAGDELTLRATAEGDPSSALEIEYEIARDETIVTQGSLTLRRESANHSTPNAKSGRADSLLREPLTERNAWFDQINVGDADTLNFTISAASLKAFSALLASSQSPIDPASFLGVSLFSTLVGMCQPGRQATFLNFDAAFATPLKVGAAYQLEGKVAFKSASTMTLNSGVTISTNGAVAATGKTHARVNSPPAMMPSLQSLKDTALDSGLRGKVVLITGASRGLGQTTARLFALHGAKVAINYLSSRATAESLAQEIRDAGGEAIAVKADVRRRVQVRKMAQAIVAKWGRLDVLVNNAVGDFQSIPFLDLTWEQMEADLSVIVEGAFHCCQAVLPHMLKQGGGKIINLSTIAVENPPAGQAKYVTAKSALVGLTRSLAVEFASKNIQINLVVPGMVETDLTKHVPKVFVNKLKAETPMNRLADPADVAKAIVFLASAQSSFTTGQKLMVTGGATPMF